MNTWRSPLSSSPNWISAIAVWPIEASPTPKPTIPCGQQAADTTKRQLGSRVSGNNWVVTAIEEQLSDRSATGSVKAEPPFPPSYLLTERCVEHAVAAETILRPNSSVRSGFIPPPAPAPVNPLPIPSMQVPPHPSLMGGLGKPSPSASPSASLPAVRPCSGRRRQSPRPRQTRKTWQCAGRQAAEEGR